MKRQQTIKRGDHSAIRESIEEYARRFQVRGLAVEDQMNRKVTFMVNHSNRFSTAIYQEAENFGVWRFLLCNLVQWNLTFLVGS
jgi:hypothetical protein